MASNVDQESKQPTQVVSEPVPSAPAAPTGVAEDAEVEVIPRNRLAIVGLQTHSKQRLVFERGPPGISGVDVVSFPLRAGPGTCARIHENVC